MNKDMKRLFLVLALYALSDGVLYNFQELWMMENNLSIKTISTVFSICAIITVSSIFVLSNIVKKERMKQFASILLVLKFAVAISLYFLYGSGLNILIKFLTMVDYVLQVECVACFYPMMSLISKNDKVYASKDLSYAGLYAVGVLLTSVLLGSNILGITLSYNSYWLIAAVLILISFVLLITMDFSKYVKNTKEVNQQEEFEKLITKIKKDKITKIYLLFYICGQISYTTVLGLTMTFLTTGIGLESSVASIIYLTTGLAGVGFGVLALSKLTPKNLYIPLSVKYLFRTLGYIAAVIFNSKIIFLIAFLYPKFVSSAYTHVTDAPYANRFDKKYQLAFSNLLQMVSYVGIAIGVFICGRAMEVSIKLNFAIAAVLCLGQWLFSFQALYLRTQEEKKKNDRKQLGQSA